MTKKRFYKLLRAHLVELKCLTKSANQTCKKMPGLRRDTFVPSGYQQIWEAMRPGERRYNYSC